MELLVQRSLRWFGHAARRPEGELIKDLLLPTPPRTWRRRTGGQLKTWVTTTKADLEPISGPRTMEMGWVKVSFVGIHWDDIIWFIQSLLRPRPAWNCL